MDTIVEVVGLFLFTLRSIFRFLDFALTGFGSSIAITINRKLKHMQLLDALLNYTDNSTPTLEFEAGNLIL